MKVRLKMEKRSQRYDYGYRYTKYKICLGIMIRRNKQDLNKILGSIHEKVKQH